REAVAQLPLQSLLLETDAPDMPLCGHQGEANNPLYLPEIARCLAQLRGESVEDIATQTTENSVRLFGI
ncbi:MAG: TatD family hydrolase, partial [Porticoccaceae bacterium]|nr:TatD family hydrolase [Porticoccaceae bacterium]